MNTSIRPWQAKRLRYADREAGSLVLDILIGMAIFALIAIIAVSAISQYRARAYEQGSVSDATAFGAVMEADFTDDQAYPLTAAAALAAFAAAKGNFTKGVTVPATGGYVRNDRAFAVCVEHRSGGVADSYAVYNSYLGGLVASGRDTGCTAPAAVAAMAITDAAPAPLGWSASTTPVECPQVTEAVVTKRVGSPDYFYVDYKVTSAPPAGVSLRLLTGNPAVVSYMSAWSVSPHPSGEPLTYRSQVSMSSIGTRRFLFTARTPSLRSFGCTQGLSVTITQEPYTIVTTAPQTSSLVTLPPNDASNSGW